MIEAAGHGHKSIVEYLLDRGANIEAKELFGDTALLKAAHFGQKAEVECLIDRGADIEARNDYGETPILTACRSVNENRMKSKIVPTIKLLCCRGANVSVQDKKGYSSLKYAREVKDSDVQEELIRVLEKYGARELTFRRHAGHGRHVLERVNHFSGASSVESNDRQGGR